MDPDTFFGGTDPDPNTFVRGTDPDLDPHQNGTDPQHCTTNTGSVCALVRLLGN